MDFFYCCALFSFRLKTNRKTEPAMNARTNATSPITQSGISKPLTRTLGVTERPGPMVWSAGSGSSKRIFTGTRWTTFT